MSSEKLPAGAEFPDLTVSRLGGGTIALGSGDEDWQLVIVYRGKHCPLCTRYLKELNSLVDDYAALGVGIVAVSADPEEKARVQMDEIAPRFEVGYGLSLDQMAVLGVYVSEPRSPKETDRPFAEPGLFVVNGEGRIQITDISNAPFARPDLETLRNGVKFIRDPENNYPIRGTYAA